MRRAWLVVAIALAAALGCGVWAFALEPASLVTPTYAVSIPRWPAELSGLRIAVLADLHVGSPFNGLAKLDTIVERTNRLKPDLILIPGDFVVHGVWGGTFVPPEQTAAVLARLAAPLGVWACLGNHDWWLGAERVATALT